MTETNSTPAEPHHKILVFFTWDISLKIWEDKGLLEREIRYYNLLAQKGVRITFITWGDEGELSYQGLLHRNITLFPAYKKLPHPKNKAIRALLSPLVLWHARHLVKSSTLLKTNQMWGSWCAVLGKIIFRKNLLARTGFELHRFTIAQGHGLTRRLFTFLISKITYATADKIYLATEEDKQFVIENFRIRPSKISLHPNWIDVERFKPLNIEKKENSLLFVGRLNEQKNIPMLFQAIDNSNWTLSMAGDGELREELQEKARQTNAEINFLGTYPNDSLPELYNSHAVYILPSFFEGNPKTLLEAMACGCAVIGTDSDGIRNLIRNNENGLLSQMNAMSLKNAIKRFMADTELRKNAGEKARRTVADNQSLEKMVSKEIAEYPVF